MSVTLLMLSAPAADAAGFTIDNLEPIVFTEGGDPVRVAPDATISGSGGFADGFLRFAIADARETETLGFLTSAAPDTTEGAVSVVGEAIYLGLGGGASKQIATVSGVESGTAGSPLRIDFSAALENSDFSGGTQANGDPVGWEVNRELVWLGALASRTQQRSVAIAGSGPYTIEGPDYSFKTDFNYDPSSHPAWGFEGDERALDTPGSYSAGVVAHGERSQALRLQMTGGWCQGPNSEGTYCSSFGPDAWSSPFEAKAGDDLAFDWAAANGSDDYEVYGFLVNTATDQHHLLMYGRGYQQGWATAAGQIPADGTYRFRFVSGSYDRTGGHLLGASLYIDNARVLSSDATDEVATQIARLVTYHDSSDNPSKERQIAVDAETPTGGSLPPTEVPTEVELVDDPPVLAPPAEVVVTNGPETEDHTPIIGYLDATDPEDDPITYVLPDGEAHAGEVAGMEVDQRQVGMTGTLYLDSATGTYVWAVDADLANGLTEPVTESFNLRVDAYSDYHDQTLSDSGQITARVDIASTPPTAPTGLKAVASDQEVGLGWKAPWWTGGEEEVTYVVQRLVGGDWQTVLTDLDAPEATLTGLTNGEEVVLRVRALNVHGQSEATADVSVTPRTVPATVVDLQVDEGDGRLEVRWAAPENDGGAAVTGYQVSSSQGSCGVEAITVEGDGRDWFGCTINGLTNASAVTVTVKPTNVVGEGPAASVTGVPYAAPLAPVVTVVRGDGQLEVSWTVAPANGRAVEGYEILIDGKIAAATDAKSRSVTVDGLRNGARYEVAVRGLNLAGPGTSGQAMGTPATVPGVPVVDEVRAGNRILSVSFTAPNNDGGSTLVGYQYSLDGGATWTSIPLLADSEPIVLRGLSNGTSYNVSLRAVNAMGAGFATLPNKATPRLVPVWSPSPDGQGGSSDDPLTGDLAGQDTRPAPGTARVLIDGQEVPATLRPDGTRLHIEGDGFGIELRGTEVDGKPMVVDSEGRLVVRAGGMVLVSGWGFAPDSMVDVWLFSEPHWLGEVPVGVDGTFAASLPLPEGIDSGEHTVQLNGINTDGELRSASTQLAVVETEEAAPGPQAEPMSDGVAERITTRADRGSASSLPRTGTSLAPLGLLGLLALLLGRALVVSGATRRDGPGRR